MHIQLNGKNYALNKARNVSALLEQLQLADRRVAVELNQEVVPRSMYETTALNNGDSVEVVHAIGGG